MDDLLKGIASNTSLFILGLGGFCLLFLLLSIVLVVKFATLQKRVERFVGSRSDKRNLEALFAEHNSYISAIGDQYDDILALVDNINERLRFCTQKVGVVRYNPFEGMGGDLSFAVALLDEENNGVVFNTIHGREASYTYAKPVVAGVSSYTLSVEELDAIHIAMDQNKLIMSYPH